mmetsp:Transcript_14448/g.37172  ORF Transcript_14448/g.37172 Transcript_14448/m.37172 type:complete len:214 (-) Transcript_14448:163-804(-)
MGRVGVRDGRADAVAAVARPLHLKQRRHQKLLPRGPRSVRQGHAESALFYRRQDREQRLQGQGAIVCSAVPLGRARPPARWPWPSISRQPCPSHVVPPPEWSASAPRRIRRGGGAPRSPLRGTLPTWPPGVGVTIAPPHAPGGKGCDGRPGLGSIRAATGRRTRAPCRRKTRRCCARSEHFASGKTKGKRRDSAAVAPTWHPRGPCCVKHTCL